MADPTLEETLAAAFVRGLRPSSHFASGALPASLDVDARDLTAAVHRLLLDYPEAIARHEAAKAAAVQAAAEQTRQEARRLFTQDHPAEPIPAELETAEETQARWAAVAELAAAEQAKTAAAPAAIPDPQPEGGHR